MIEFYGAPNSQAFWHWPTLLHFLLVGLAGGSALLAAIFALREHPATRKAALVALGLIVLDLLVLWLESPARFRFSHIWIFLSFSPTSAIWLGAWGLSISAAMTALLALRWGPAKVWAGILLVSATVAFLYPGLALAANVNRPLWTPILLILMPVSSLLIVLGLALVLRLRWASPWVLGLSLGSFIIGGLYLLGLAYGNADAQAALSHFWHDGGLLYLLGLALLLAGPALLRRSPTLAGLLPVGGAILIRSLIIEIGQYQGFGF